MFFTPFASCFPNPIYLNQIKVFPYFNLSFLLQPTGTSSSTSTTSVLPTVAESVVGAAEPDGGGASEPDGGVAEADARRGRV
jgi:hypothetical protein